MAKHNEGRRKPTHIPTQRRRREFPFWRWFLWSVFSLLRRHGNAVVMWLVIGWCFHDGSQAFIAYAGKTSLASFSVELLASVQSVFTLSITTSGMSVALYLRERRNHRKTRDRLTDRITELEVKLDPHRTSSLLTPEGLTRKEDE